MFFSPRAFILKGEIVSKKIYFQGITFKKVKVASPFHIIGDKSFMCQIHFHLSFSIISSIAGALTTSVSDATENFMLNCYDYNWFNGLFSTFSFNFKKVFFGGENLEFQMLTCFILKSSYQSSISFHGKTNTLQLLFQF